jgi:hypothetical protein
MPAARPEVTPLSGAAAAPHGYFGHDDEPLRKIFE